MTKIEKMIGKEINITDIQLYFYKENRQISEYDYESVYSYSANIAINAEFMVQVSGDENTARFDGIPFSVDACWNDPDKQDYYAEKINDKDLEKILEERGFENNVFWLEDHATDIFNPENRNND